MPGDMRVSARWPPLELRAAAFDRLDAGAAVIDSDGLVVTTNQAWRLFAHLNDGSAVGTGLGINYLEICEQAAVVGEPGSGEIAAGVREILRGERFSARRRVPVSVARRRPVVSAAGVCALARRWARRRRVPRRRHGAQACH